MSITIDHAEWRRQAVARYGEDAGAWRFRCPCCGHAASVADYIAAGDKEMKLVAFSCIGRLAPGVMRIDARAEGVAGGPCSYAGGGLFRLNPITVTDMPLGGSETFFDFADRPLTEAPA